MLHKIFTIHDSAAAAYLAPFFLPEEAQAIRGFKDAINLTPDHPFGKHPKDYTLMEIGTFDDSNGTITTYQTQKPLGNGLSFLQTVQDKDQLSLLEEVTQ